MIGDAIVPLCSSMARRSKKWQRGNPTKEAKSCETGLSECGNLPP